MSKLDSYLGTQTGQSTMFELRLHVITMECGAIAHSTEIMAWLKEPSAALARYDLRRSAQALRDAASRLDDIMAKHGPKHEVLEAAE